MEFVKSFMKVALTRGQDGVGKDLTGYFKKAFAGFFSKNRIEMPEIDGEEVEDFAVGFEAVISWENLEKMNEEFGTTYKNPRSAIGGIIKEDGLPMSKYLTLVPLKYRAQVGSHVTRLDEFEALQEVARQSPHFYEMEVTVIESVNDLEDAYHAIAENRFDLPFMIDGIVVETGDQDLRDELDFTDNRPNFAIAFKLPYMEKETKLIDVKWYTDGNSATYTPVAVLEPVILINATYQNVSLANYGRFKQMELRKGDRMLFSLNNDVLGYVDKLPTVHPRGKEGKAFLPPSNCECCGEPLHTDEVFLFCVNDDCDLVKVGRLQQFLEKMGIKGIKRNTIKAMYDVGIIEDVTDFLHFDETKQAVIARTEGFGKTSAAKICEAINNKIYGENGVYDYELMGSLNVELISRDRAKLVLRHIDPDTLLYGDRKEVEAKLRAVDGIGDAIIDAIFDHKNLIADVFLAFREAGIKIKGFFEELKANQVEGKKYTVVVTGNLKGYGREEFKEAIERLGHKMASSISRKTDYLVTNDTSSGTIKNKKALDLGVKVIDEAEAIKVLGIHRNSRKRGSIEEAFD